MVSSFMISFLILSFRGTTRAHKGPPNHIRVFGRQGTDNKEDSHDSG
jgi:hypothetical protein